MISENQSVSPDAPSSGFDTRTKGRRRRPGVVRLLILLAAIGGAVLWTARIVWENRHPAIAAARGLKAGSAPERLAAVRNLTDAGVTDTAVAIPRLTSALNDPDAGVRTATVESLGLLIAYSIRSRASEREARAAVPALLDSLKDSQAAVRIAAIRVLSTIRELRRPPRARRRKRTPRIPHRSSTPRS